MTINSLTKNHIIQQNYRPVIPIFNTCQEFYDWRVEYLAPYLIEISGDPLKELDEIVEQLVIFQNDTLRAVLFLWDWGYERLENCRLEQWQLDTLADITEHLLNPETRYKPLKIAVSSGHGIGKSAFMSMVQIALLSTMEFTRVNELANTGAQLMGKTWPELQKWLDMSLVRDWFDFNATSLAIKGEDAKKWRSDAVTWSLNNLAAVAGLHNKDRRILVLFDEASEIPGKIFEVYEGAMTDENTQIIWIAFGNPTLNSGAFYDLFYSNKSKWKGRHIDSRSVTLTNKAYLQECVDTYGEDSDFVRVRIRGLPPSSSVNQCISSEWIAAARNRIIKSPEEFSYAPCIVGIDGSWTGEDSLEVYVRQGPYCKHILSIAKNDNDVTTASRIIQEVQAKHPFPVDGWILDQGFGTGIYSALVTLKLKNVHLVPFGGESPEVGLINMRTYIWSKMGIWCRDSGVIFNDVELELELSRPELHQVKDGRRMGWWILESKKNMATRGVKSPNKADALAVTFALNIQKLDPVPTVLGHHAHMKHIRAMKNTSPIQSAYKGLF